MGNEVEEIKKKLDIVEQINRVLPLKKRGRHYVACCPFHSEKTPSFTVSPELQIYKCFGCGKGGDIFNFYQEYFKIDFRESLEELAKIAGVKLISYAGSNEESQRKKILLINQEVAKFYHFILQNHQIGADARKYLGERGIENKTIEKFKIGLAPTDSRLIINYLKKKFNENDLVASGSFGWSQYGIKRMYDRFSGRLIFPLIDFRGKVIGFSGRVLPGAKKELAKYINSPETEVYHKSQTVYGIFQAKEAIRQKGEVVVTEGEFDMISPFQAGIENIIAIKGTAFTPEQLQLLRRYSDSLVLALDTDFAGNKAAIRSIQLAEEMDFEIRVAEMGKEYKDPDEAVRDNPEKFKQMITDAVSIWDFIIDSSVENNNTETIKGKKEVLAVCLPFLVKIKNEVIRSDYVRKLAVVIGSEVGAVMAEMTKYQAGNKATEKMVTTPEIEKKPIEAQEERLLILVLATKSPKEVIKTISEVYRFKTDRYQKIADLITESRVDSHQPLKNIPDELRDIFSSIYLLAQRETNEPNNRKIEIEKLLAKLKSEELNDEMKNLSNLIGKFEKLGKEKEVLELEIKYQNALGQLSKWQKRGKW